MDIFLNNVLVLNVTITQFEINSCWHIENVLYLH